MKRKLAALILTAAMLAGCSLAQPDTGANLPDRLVGAVVTTAYIKTDMDFTVTAGGRVVPDESGNRIEGTPIYTEGTDRLEGVEFPGVEGYTLLLCRYGEGENSSVSIAGNDEFYDLGIHSKVTDEGETNTIRGTLKADMSRAEIVLLYTNPVYQTPEGGFYLVPGGGISTNCEDGQSFTMSQSIDEQFTEDFAGKRTLSGSRVEVTFEGGYPGERFTLLQLDGENRIVKEESWTAEEVPDRLTLGSDTELALLETHYTDRQGEQRTRAEVVGRGEFFLNEETGMEETAIRVYLPGQDGVCRVKVVLAEIGKEQ